MKIPPDVSAAIKAFRGSRTPEPLADQMWREAVSFHESAQRNFEQRKGRDGRYAFPFTAGVVGLAFAAELYLKTLLLLANGKAPSGHRLNVLYAKLPERTQALVRARYEQRREGSGDDFASDLLMFSNAFVEFRYVYEGGGKPIDVVGLGQLASSLYEVARKLHPNLKLYEYTHFRVTSASQGMPIFSRVPEEYFPPPPWPNEAAE